MNLLESIPLLIYGPQCESWRESGMPRSTRQAAPSAPPNDDTSSGTKQRCARLGIAAPLALSVCPGVSSSSRRAWGSGPGYHAPELLTQRFRIIPFLRGDDAQPFAGTAPFARADLDGIKQRPHLCPLVPLGRRGAVGQGHAAALGQAVDEHPFAFPSAGDALAPTLARGKKRHRRRHTPNESSPVPRPSPDSGLASRRACYPPASVATSDAWRSSTPIVVHGGHHTTGSR